MHCEIQNPKAGGHPRLVKATKRHICRECCRDIQPGEKYYRVDGVWEKPATFYKRRREGQNPPSFTWGM